MTEAMACPDDFIETLPDALEAITLATEMSLQQESWQPLQSLLSTFADALEGRNGQIDIESERNLLQKVADGHRDSGQLNRELFGHVRPLLSRLEVSTNPLGHCREVASYGKVELVFGITPPSNRPRLPVKVHSGQEAFEF